MIYPYITTVGHFRLKSNTQDIQNIGHKLSNLVELWQDYWSRFCTFVAANSIPDDRKAQVFLTSQSPALYKQLSNLAAQKTPQKDINSLTMKKITEFMEDQYDYI